MRRNKRICFGVFFSTIIVFLAGRCDWAVAQEFSVADVLPANTSLLMETERIDQLVQYLEDSSLIQDPNWIKAVEAVTDARFPLVHSERIEPLLEIVSELQNVAVDINRLSVVVQDTGQDGRPQISIIIEADEEVVAALSELLERLNSQIAAIAKPVSMEPVKDEGGQKLIFNRRIGKWWVISDSESSLDTLSNNLTSPPRNPLANSRKFKTIKRLLASKASDLFCATIYADTNSLFSLLPGLSKDKWQAMRMKELPACGVSMRIPSKRNLDNSDKSLAPDLVFESVVMFTHPRTGYGKMLEAFRSIPSFPALGLPIYELNIQEVDSPAQFQAISEMQDSVSGSSRPSNIENEARKMAMPVRRDELSYREKAEQNYAAMGLDLQETLEFSSGSLLMRYVDEQSHEHEILQMRRVAVPGAAKNYTRKFVQYLNKSRTQKNRISKHDCDHGELYVAADTQGRFARSETYFGNEDWYMTGIEPAVRKQLSATYDGEATQWIPYQERIEDLRRRVFLDGDLVRVDCFSPYSWIVQATSPGANRIDEKRKKSKSVKSWKLEIEDVKDLQARVSTLIGLALANRFGSQIHLHSQDDQRLRIIVGVYEKPEAIFGEWHQEGKSPYLLEFDE